MPCAFSVQWIFFWDHSCFLRLYGISSTERGFFFFQCCSLTSLGWEELIRFKLNHCCIEIAYCYRTEFSGNKNSDDVPLIGKNYLVGFISMYEM